MGCIEIVCVAVLHRWSSCLIETWDVLKSPIINSSGDLNSGLIETWDVLKYILLGIAQGDWQSLIDVVQRIRCTSSMQIKCA